MRGDAKHLVQAAADQKDPGIRREDRAGALEVWNDVREPMVKRLPRGGGLVPQPDHLVARGIRRHPVEQRAPEVPVQAGVSHARCRPSATTTEGLGGAFELPRGRIIQDGVPGGGTSIATSACRSAPRFLNRLARSRQYLKGKKLQLLEFVVCEAGSPAHRLGAARGGDQEQQRPDVEEQDIELVPPPGTDGDRGRVQRAGLVPIDRDQPLAKAGKSCDGLGGTGRVRSDLCEKEAEKEEGNRQERRRTSGAEGVRAASAFLRDTCTACRSTFHVRLSLNLPLHSTFTQFFRLLQTTRWP